MHKNRETHKEKAMHAGTFRPRISMSTSSRMHAVALWSFRRARRPVEDKHHAEVSVPLTLTGAGLTAVDLHLRNVLQDQTPSWDVTSSVM